MENCDDPAVFAAINREFSRYTGELNPSQAASNITFRQENWRPEPGWGVDE